jgi:hypothetical protein
MASNPTGSPCVPPEKPTTSFANDIGPMFAPFRANMIWRFDLGDYGTVKANANLIWGQISTQSMPPAPLPPLDASLIALYKTWMDECCPP